MSPSPPPNRNRCLLGGTFDRMHIGHEKLITTCLKRCDYLEIWLTSDEMASEKIGNVQSFELSVGYRKTLNYTIPWLYF